MSTQALFIRGPRPALPSSLQPILNRREGYRRTPAPLCMSTQALFIRGPRPVRPLLRYGSTQQWEVSNHRGRLSVSKLASCGVDPATRHGTRTCCTSTVSCMQRGSSCRSTPTIMQLSGSLHSCLQCRAGSSLRPRPRMRRASWGRE